MHGVYVLEVIVSAVVSNPFRAGIAVHFPNNTGIVAAELRFKPLQSGALLCTSGGFIDARVIPHCFKPLQSGALLCTIALWCNRSTESTFQTPSERSIAVHSCLLNSYCPTRSSFKPLQSGALLCTNCT